MPCAGLFCCRHLRAVVKLKSATTVQGQSVAVDATDGVKINGSKVVKADIVCGNGVIHVIDTVLLPKE